MPTSGPLHRLIPLPRTLDPWLHFSLRPPLPDHPTAAGPALAVAPTLVSFSSARSLLTSLLSPMGQQTLSVKHKTVSMPDVAGHEVYEQKVFSGHT